jgi:voltage-gated potassium channel
MRHPPEKEEGRDARERREREDPAVLRLFSGVLALLCVVLLILQDRMDLTDAQDELIEWVDLGIWIAFAADYCVNLYFAADRRTYVRTHIVELVAILPSTPFSRDPADAHLSADPLHTAPAGVAAVPADCLLRADAQIRLAVSAGHNFHYVVFFHRFDHSPGRRRDRTLEKMDLNDAIWWAFVTATTVGYGDISPASPGGRIVAVVLMLVGIGFISTLTGRSHRISSAPKTRPPPATSSSQRRSDGSKTSTP